ncbi:MAG: hypothetical protein COU71_01270 [Parcubacteria group bacterium CG10_big_fil_rev_8_21_14_0_10_38_31]|nr:MAG: hypothetical protein COU71_01270 [Parcubacteria group bacterium CG10_big_fil_rev_8_21_14_0_10_38_31]
MKLIIKKHILFIILVLILGVYLGAKAIPENSWDDWGFGSAQTMMSSKHWVNDGFVYSKFLFLPTGYSKAVRYIDDSDLRQHAHGIRTGELVGNRLYYTHYPSGYLLPYATLMKVGFSERFWFRFLAILISLSGLSLMYAFFSLISTRMIAFLATLYYAGSTMFLGIADSLANQPVDDLFRFLILFLSIWVYRISDDKKKRFYNTLIWFLYFALASSSYDSTFFIFVWLVGLDIIMTRKILWKKWLILALAPVVAFTVQLLQNIWYLGFGDSLLDIYGSFRARANTGPGAGVLERHIRAVFSPWVYMADLRARFIIPVIVILFTTFAFLKKRVVKNLYNFPKNEIMGLLAISGFAYPFILVSSGYFPYQARQIAPFISLLLASSTVLVFLSLKNIKNWPTWKPSFQVGGVVLLVLVSLLWFKQTERTYEYIKQWPNNVVEESIINESKKIKYLAEGGDTVLFRLDSNSEYRYPQVNPFFEYYIGYPVLSFNSTSDLTEDLKKLSKRSEFKFKSIIMTENSNEQKDISVLLRNSNIDYEFFKK